MPQPDIDHSIADSFRARISIEGFRDYWQTYQVHHHEIESALLKSLMASPKIRPMVSGITQEMWEVMRRTAYNQMEQALVGDWEPLVESLLAQGAWFAKSKLPFRDWYAIPMVLTRKIVPKLVDAFHTEPERLSRALMAANEYADATMALLGDAYLKAELAETKRQQARTRKHAHALSVTDRLLKKHTAILEAVLGAMSDGVVLCTPDGVLPVINHAAQTLLDVEEETLGRARWLGPRSDVWLLPDGHTPLPEEQHPIMQALNGQTARDLEFIHRDTPDAPSRHILADISPLYLDEILVGALVIFRDVTERRQMTQLMQRSEELERENRLIEAASHLKSEFLANMSHELRTPLNAILGFSELIYDGAAGPTTSTQLEFLDDILMSGRHLLQLINDVLDLAKVEAGRLRLHSETTDVSTLASEVIAVMHNAAARQHVEMRLVDCSEPLEAFLDPSRVRQVLYNFLSNAIKFTPENGRVNVRLKTVEPQGVLIEVEDTGIGIAKADIPRLFREFEQLSVATTKRVGGTGLGLALTRNLVEAMGGVVGVRSTVGEGSTFFAVLPTNLPCDEPVAKIRAQPGALWDSPRVLAVNGVPTHQALFLRNLSDAGFAVVAASTGAQAAQMARDEKFEAILLDVSLPDCSAFDAMEAIGTHGRNTTTPLALVSVSPDEQLTASFAVTGVLRKPSDPERFKHALISAGVLLKRHDAPILVVGSDSSLLRQTEANLIALGYPAVCFTHVDEAVSWLAKKRPSAIVLDLLMPDIDSAAFLQRLDSIQEEASLPIFLWTLKDRPAEERRVIHKRAHTVFLERKPTKHGFINNLASALRSSEEPAGEP